MINTKWMPYDKLRLYADGKTYQVEFANNYGTSVKVSILEKTRQFIFCSI